MNRQNLKRLEEEETFSLEKIVINRINEIERKIKEQKEQKDWTVFQEKKVKKEVEEFQFSKSQIKELQKTNKELEKTIEDMKKKEKNEKEISEKTIELLQNTIEGMSIEKEKNKEKLLKPIKNQLKNELKIKSEELNNELLIQFSTDIVRFIEDTFDKHLNHFPIGALKELINSIQNVEPTQNLLTNMIRSDEANHINFLSNEMKHYNILVIGATGVGKTTLIKSILKLKDKEKRKSTEGYQAYESTGIRLWDTKGINKIEDAEKEFTQFINEKIEKGNIDEFIHCIWYCVTGEQFTKTERKFLHKLSSLYKESIPVIIVYTKAIDDNKVEEMEKIIKEEKNYSLSFIPVIAKDITRKKNKKISLDKSEGLDKLIKISQNKMELIPFYACITSVHNKIERGFYDIIEKRRTYCLNYIPEVNYLKKTFNSYSSEKLKEYILLFCNEIVSKMIYDFEDSLKIETMELLSSFFDDNIFPWVDKLISDIKKNFIEEKGKVVELEN